MHKVEAMDTLWPACGAHLLARDDSGWLRPTDAWLRAWLARPELAPTSFSVYGPEGQGAMAEDARPAGAQPHPQAAGRDQRPARKFGRRQPS